MTIFGRYVPWLRNVPFRITIGLLLAVAAVVVSRNLVASDRGHTVSAMIIGAWFVSVLLTDKYRHKYPQRYYSYLVASHFKAVTVMVALGLLFWAVGLLNRESVRTFGIATALLSLGDFLISIPRRRTPVHSIRDEQRADTEQAASTNAAPVGAEIMVSVNTEAIVATLSATVPPAMAAFIRTHLPLNTTGTDKAFAFNDLDDAVGGNPPPHTAGVVIGCRPLNHVSRLNNYLRFCVGQLAMGGYLVVSYTPLESVLADMRRRVSRVLYPFAYIKHFLWYRAIPKIPWVDKFYFSPFFKWFDPFLQRCGGRRNRSLPKAEMWGRLAYYGLEVLNETDEDGRRYLVAQRLAPPVANRKPSFYAVVALEKVGLDGTLIRLHKIRSMYPFSEFLQKKIFQSYGLSNTGKFKNDFRLTDYGPLIRRRWIDEIPGIVDWLRGDVKLVGMRATSPHFLSLYPKEVYDLYIQVKPGLVPPIFDASTNGFEDIVRIEMAYLEDYIKAPIRTDVRYFFRTFHDIFIRGVRSK
jgi:lipopolysaccharide/colanic/teichoic acid biosynthesis glycosyltransferase